MLCSPRLCARQLAGLTEQADIVVPDWRRAALSVRNTCAQRQCGQRKPLGRVLGQHPTGALFLQIAADRRPDLAKIECPRIVVCGRDDAATPLFLPAERPQPSRAR